MSVDSATESAVDDVDRAIIHCLQLDGRVPFRRIADVLGISEQTVARRYRRMRSEGIVRVVTLVAPWSYGETSWMVRIQARPDSVRALARALAERDDVAWVTIAGGGTDITAAIHSRSAADRDELLLERLPRATQVLGMSVHAVMNRFSRSNGVDWTVQSPLVTADVERLLTERRASSGQAASPSPPAVEDAPLVAALALDGRVSIADLAKLSGCSEARANRRVTALLDSGAIYLDVDVAYELLGFIAGVDIWLTIEPGHLDAVGSALVELPEIAFCAALTGSSNLTAVALFRNNDEVYRFVTERIGSLPGVRQADISPVHSNVKQAGSFVERRRLTGIPSRRSVDQPVSRSTSRR